MNKILLSFLLAIFAVAGATAAAGEMSHGGGHDMPGAEDRESWSATDDAAFLFGMIEHHKGALAMAGAVRTSRDRDVAEWAKDILEDQQEEITLMQAMIRDRGLTDPGYGATMKAEMDAMMRSPMDNDPDVNFVAMMVPHHAGAIDMSLPALVESGDKRIRKLARDIIEAQAEEIYEFKDWLEKHGH